MTMLENNRARTGRCARLPVMVRVQRQRSLTAYRPCYAIHQGTLFPALNKPLRHRHCCDDDHRNGDEALTTGRIIDENGTCDRDDDRDDDREHRCCEQGDDRERRCCDRDDDRECRCCDRDDWDDWNDGWMGRCCDRDNWDDDWMGRCCDRDDWEGDRCRCCDRDDDDRTGSQEGDGTDQHQATSFALWELRLYLDTHPCDTRALTMLRRLDARTDQPSYATAFLTEGRRCCREWDRDDDDRDSGEGRRCCWRWVEEPWPWEECLRDCCHGHA